MNRRSMATNSPMDDPSPQRPPEPEKIAKRPKNSWARLGSSAKYPEVEEYFKTRIAYYQQFLPGGTPIETLNEEQQKEAWGNAVVIIKELQNANTRIQTETASAKAEARG